MCGITARPARPRIDGVVSGRVPGLAKGILPRCIPGQRFDVEPRPDASPLDPDRCFGSGIDQPLRLDTASGFGPDMTSRARRSCTSVGELRIPQPASGLCPLKPAPATMLDPAKEGVLGCAHDLPEATAWQAARNANGTSWRMSG